MHTRYETDRLVLRILNARHRRKILEFLQNNRTVFDACEPLKPAAFYTEEFQRRLIAQEYHSSMRNTFFRFYIFRKEQPDQIIGSVSFGQIQEAPFYSCSIGYKLDTRFQGFGYAREAVSAAISILCDTIPIHRITAYILPENTRSIRLAEELHFQYEGTCMRLVNIGGNWRDHLKYVYINHAAEAEVPYTSIR